MVTTSVTQDVRPIESLLCGVSGWRVRLGERIWPGYHVSKITCYTENGEMAVVPWFAVWVSDHRNEITTIAQRIPGKNVHVRYEQP